MSTIKNKLTRWWKTVKKSTMARIETQVGAANSTEATTGKGIQFSNPAGATENREPVLSVVMPTYNVELYVQDAVGSVLNQTLTDLELLVVDDGSTDTTRQLVEKMATADRRIKLTVIENSGNGRARNIGIEQARGKYLTFADSDDIVPAAAYEKMVRSLTETGSDFVCGAFERLDDGRKYIPRAAKRANPSLMQATSIQDHPQAMDNPFLWSKLFVTEFWRKSVGYLPEGTNYEDQLPTARAYAHSSKFDIIPDCVYTWRLRPGGSLTQNKHQLKDLDQRATVVNSLRAVYKAAGTDVYQRWLAKLLQDDFYYFAVVAYRATDDYIERLSSEYKRVRGELDSDGWNYLSYMHKKVAEALEEKDGARERLEHALATFRTHGERPYSIQADPNGCALDGPLEGSPILARTVQELPVNSSDLTPSPVLLGVEDGEPGQVVVKVYYGIRGLDPSLIEVKSAYSCNSNGSVTSHAFRMAEDERANHISADAFINQSAACVNIVFDPEFLDERHYGKWLNVKLELSVLEYDSICYTVAAGVPKFSYYSSVNDDFTRSILARRSGSLTWRVERVRAIARDIALISKSSLHMRVHHDGDPYVDVRLGEEHNRDSLDLRAIFTPESNCKGSVDIDLTSAGGTAPLTARSSFSLDLVREDGTSTRIAVANSENDSFEPSTRASCLRLEASGWGYSSVVYQRWRPVATHVELVPASNILRVSGQASINEALTPTIGLVDSKGTVAAEALVLRDPETSGWVAELDLGNFVDEWSGLRNARYLLRWKSSWHRNVRNYYYIEFGFDVTRGDCITRISDRFAADIERSHTGYTAIVLRPPFSESERGRFNQRLLQASFFSAKRPAISTDAIFVECFDGKSFADNVAPVVEEIVRQDSSRRVFVGVLNSIFNLPEYVTPVVRYSSDWYHALATSNIVLTNNNFPEWFVKHESQTFVQLWHGTPLKRLLFDMLAESKHLEYWLLMERQIKDWDLLIAQNEFSRDIFRRCFNFTGRIEVTGYPRNDVLAEHQNSGARVRDQFGVHQNEVLVLYMPTWREALRGSDGKIRPTSYADWDLIVPALNHAASKHKYRVMHRSHHVSSATNGLNANVIDVSDYPSVSELFLAADVLVTDYSSAMFDFSITNKPMVFMAPDYVEYSNAQRGLYFDLMSMAPGPVVGSSIELLDVLSNWPKLSKTTAFDNYSEFRDRFVSDDDGRSSERVASQVLALASNCLSTRT